MSEQSHIGGYVEARLVELGKWGTQKEIADASGVSDATWRSLLRGDVPSRRDVVRKVTAYLEWPVPALEWLALGDAPTDWRVTYPPGVTRWERTAGGDVLAVAEVPDPLPFRHVNARQELDDYLAELRELGDSESLRIAAALERFGRFVGWDSDRGRAGLANDSDRAGTVGVEVGMLKHRLDVLEPRVERVEREVSRLARMETTLEAVARAVGADDRGAAVAVLQVEDAAEPSGTLGLAAQQGAGNVAGPSKKAAKNRAADVRKAQGR